MADRGAGAGTCGLQRDRGAGEPAVGLQMKSIIDTPEADPTVWVRQTGRDREVRHRLFAGDARARGQGGGGHYLRARSVTVNGFTVESTVLDELKKEPSEYRQKDLFDARSFNATRIEIVRADRPTPSRKRRRRTRKRKWRQVSPQTRELDQPTFDKLVSALTGIRATGFVDAPAAAKALAAPELAVAIKFDEGKKEEKVTLGKAGTDAFASRAGEPGAAKVDASAIDGAVKARS